MPPRSDGAGKGVAILGSIPSTPNVSADAEAGGGLDAAATLSEARSRILNHMSEVSTLMW